MSSPPRHPLPLRAHLIGAFALFHVWVVVFGSFGRIHLADSPVTDAIERRWADAVRATHPLRDGYGAALGPKQVWAMFAGVRKTSGRTEVAVFRDGRWEDVYVPRSEQADWRRATFDHYRFREAFQVVMTAPPRPQWVALTDWLLDEALADFPDASRARVRRMQGDMLSPDQLRAGERIAYERVIAVRERSR